MLHGRALKGLSVEFRLESCAGGNLRHAMLMGISHNPGHAGQGSNLLRSALSIAARDHDFCRWIFAMDTPDRGAGVLIGGGGDRASIQYDNVSFPGRMGL